MDKVHKTLVTVMLAALLSPGAAWGHPGKGDANGCHTDRKTGEYHCHLELERVTDGDTIKAKAGDKPITVRLYGIDAPEGKQPGGAASTAALRSLLAGNGKFAVVPYGRDRYGRMLVVAYTAAPGKTPVNQAMLEGGHAWHFGQYCTEEFCPSWKQSEMNARHARRGIWASQDPIPPWDWRSAHGR